MVGGQALCLLVTLIVRPVVYSMFDDLRGLRAFAWVRFPRWRRAVSVRFRSADARRLANGRRPATPERSAGRRAHPAGSGR